MSTWRNITSVYYEKHVMSDDTGIIDLTSKRTDPAPVPNTILHRIHVHGEQVKCEVKTKETVQ